MQVLLADEYGFCFGVERAVDMVEDALQEGDTVRSLGPLIHNEQEMARLGEHGVTTISDPVQIGRGETAVIRAHGVTPEVQKELQKLKDAYGEGSLSAKEYKKRKEALLGGKK